MKINYYGYGFTELSTGRKYLMSIRPFLQAFSSQGGSDYKNGFRHNEEHVYLLERFGGVFLFLQTRENEIIKKISSSSLAVTEINDLLKNDESIGFASYILIKDSYFGFASTVLAPKVTAFEGFVNDVLRSVGVTSHSFTVYPFVTKSTKDDVLKMQIVGRSTIQVTQDNGFFNELAKVLGGDGADFQDVDSFEVVIKPRNRVNIEKPVKAVIRRIDSVGISKFVVRAKEEARSAMIDMYLEGRGILSDEIDLSDERQILANIKEKMIDNKELEDRVMSHEQDDAFQQGNIECIAKFSNPDNWTGSLLDI